MTSNIWLPEDLLAGIALYANQPGEERGSADRGQRFIFFIPLSIVLPPSYGFFMVRFGGHTYRLYHRFYGAIWWSPTVFAIARRGRPGASLPLGAATQLDVRNNSYDRMYL